MKYKIEKKGKRYGLYIYVNECWQLHQTYLTLRGAEVAMRIMWDRNETGSSCPNL